MHRQYPKSGDVIHPDSMSGEADPAASPEQRLNKARKKIRKLRAEVQEYGRAVGLLNAVIKRRDEEIATMKAHWRPVPMAHEWQPRDAGCRMCDEPRDAPRHQSRPRGQGRDGQEATG